MQQSPASPEARATPSWRPLNGPFQRWPRTTDFLLALYAFSMSLLTWSPASSADGSGGGWHIPATFLIVLAGSAALYWRRSRPVVVHLLIIAASALVLLIGEMHNNLFAMVFSLYSLGRYATDDRASYTGLGLALALALINLLLFQAPQPPGVVVAGILIGLWYVGRRLRFRGEYLRLLEERAEQLERQRTAEAERAVADERTRIARELHDIVAHQVSLMTVQAGAAKTVARDQPDAAVEAMGSVEQAGRQALAELRHLLGVLRPDPGQADFHPQPGIAQLPQLVADLNRAGLEVTLALGELGDAVPARVDLAVYRIVQESLTNVLKHAGTGTRARVGIGREGGRMRLEVRDEGLASTNAPGSGHGIAGMSERAQVLGGTLEVGPMPGGGYRVRAFLPVNGAGE